MKQFIPYGRQSVDESDIEAVAEVLRSPHLTCGPAVENFERALAEKVGAKYAVAVANGTAALHIAYLAAELGQDDELITSPLTFAATANAALYTGAIPVFTDVQPDTGNMDPMLLEAAINYKTKIIAPIHYAGQPVDMAEISTIARRQGLLVVEDACHALGASYDGAPIGSCRYSDMAVFSFHPVKSITTGEGGAVTTNNEEFYERLKLYRSHGIVTDSAMHWKKDMIVKGFNYRLTDIQAALGTSQLKRLERFIARRNEVTAKYDQAFKGNFDITPLKLHPNRTHAHHLYPILLDKYIDRDKFLSTAREAGLGLQVHYGLVCHHTYYQGYTELDCGKAHIPVAEDFSKRVVSLPIFADITDEEVEYVISTVVELAKHSL